MSGVFKKYEVKYVKNLFKFLKYFKFDFLMDFRIL